MQISENHFGSCKCGGFVWFRGTSKESPAVISGDPNCRCEATLGTRLSRSELRELEKSVTKVFQKALQRAWRKLK